MPSSVRIVAVGILNGGLRLRLIRPTAAAHGASPSSPFGLAGHASRFGLAPRVAACLDARLRPSGFGAAAFTHFATIDFAGLPSRSSRSERRLVGAQGIEPWTSPV